MQGLRAGGHEVGMVGSCPYLDATTIYSACYMKRRGTGSNVALQAVRQNEVLADVEAAVIDVRGGMQTCGSAQNDCLIWPGLTIYCGLGMFAGCPPDVTGDITCAEMWQDMSGGHISELYIITVYTCTHIKQTWLDEPRACWMAIDTQRYDKMHQMFKTCQDIAMSTDKIGMMRLLYSNLYSNLTCEIY